MRAPSGADQADRMHARLLHQAWNPPQKRSPAQAATCNRADFVNSSIADNAAAARAAQRALAHAARRVAALEATAGRLALIGRAEAAQRLAGTAGSIRGVLA